MGERQQFHPDMDLDRCRVCRRARIAEYSRDDGRLAAGTRVQGAQRVSDPAAARGGLAAWDGLGCRPLRRHGRRAAFPWALERISLLAFLIDSPMPPSVASLSAPIKAE